MALDNHMIFRTVLIVVAALVLIALVNYYQSKQKAYRSEKFYDDVRQAATKNSVVDTFNSGEKTEVPHVYSTQDVNGVKPSDDDGNEAYKAVDYNTQQLPADCFPRDDLSAQDLLPANDSANSTWAQVNPNGQGDVGGTNFLTAGYLTGINTVGSSMKNPNLQLRSEPPNPQTVVSPWMNTSITADNSRRPLEILGDCGEY